MGLLKTILFLLIFSSSAFAGTYDIIGDGDSIANGFNGYTNPYCTAYYPGTGYQNGFWPYLVTELGGGLTYLNDGTDGHTSDSVASGIASIASAHTFTKYYLHVGINDIGTGVSLSAYLSNIGTVCTAVQGDGAEMIVNQILPSTYYTDSYTTTIKLWNAALEDWCRTQATPVKMCPVYQDFCTTGAGTENINTDYCCDTLHPSQPGYELGAHLMASAAVPSRKRVWGASSYPTFSYVSWKWAVLSGSASVTEDADKGVVNLAQNETADLTVECLHTGSKTINLSAVCRSGAVVLYYRTAATTNFARNAATLWTEYTSSFSTTDQFIQVRITNVSATPAVVRYAGMTWSGSALGAETDPETIIITSGYSGTASWQ